MRHALATSDRQSGCRKLTLNNKKGTILKMTISLLKIIPILLVMICVDSCRQPDKLSTGEGFIPVDGGKVWYRVTGTGNKTPILVLHGGPGRSKLLSETTGFFRQRPADYLLRPAGLR